MGMGATNTLDRISASLGQLGEVSPSFKNDLDIPNGGVLLALPALLANGLLNHINKYFHFPNGYYGISSILLLLAFMSLARVKFIESLRYEPPGDWGKILGLDRIPEARTLRKKVALLSNKDQPMQWSAHLCKDWMHNSPQDVAALYVDGHVRVYHGKQTKLPRHYVAREKLCARATCDYWVNAMDGKPFFLINKEVNTSFLKVLEQDIVPRLKRDIPCKYTEEELTKDPKLHRFVIIFDREGYSPDFMAKMKKQNIACQTYNKYQSEDWPEEEFCEYKLKLLSDEEITTRIGERGVFLRNKVWVREIRKMKTNNKQCSILSTNYKDQAEYIAISMFARWSQENFFAYMKKHYNLDRLMDYKTEPVSDTVKTINPEYRSLDSEIRRLNSLLNRMKLKFSSTILDMAIEPKNIKLFIEKKSELYDEINHLIKSIEKLKKKRKEIQKHIIFKELPEEHKFKRLRVQGKHLIDTIKMITYRAETSMANILKQKMAPYDYGESRSLLREIYKSTIDLKVNKQEKTISVHIHNLANRYSDKRVHFLCEELNATKTIFPGTEYRLIYKLVSFKS